MWAFFACSTVTASASFSDTNADFSCDATSDAARSSPHSACALLSTSALEAMSVASSASRAAHESDSLVCFAVSSSSRAVQAVRSASRAAVCCVKSSCSAAVLSSIAVRSFCIFTSSACDVCAEALAVDASSSALFNAAFKSSHRVCSFSLLSFVPTSDSLSVFSLSAAFLSALHCTSVACSSFVLRVRSATSCASRAFQTSVSTACFCSVSCHPAQWLSILMYAALIVSSVAVSVACKRTISSLAAASLSSAATAWLSTSLSSCLFASRSCDSSD